MTTTFCVPRPRESLNDCCSHSPMPRFETIRHASSTTTMRFALRSSVSASIIAWSQAVAQVMRIPSAVVCVLRTARRLRTTRGALEIEPGRSRPVEHPAQVSGAELVEREGHRTRRRGELLGRHRERFGHLARGVDEHVDDGGQSRLAGGAPLEHAQRLLRRALLLGDERPLERGGGDRVEEVELPLGAATRRERVQPDAAAGGEGDRPNAQRLGQPVVLALDVDDPRLPAEHRLPEDVRLDEARLRAADDPDHDRVRARELAAVKLPRVVTEGAAVDVAADVGAAPAEAALGDERVGGLDVRGRRSVPGLTADASPQPPAERQRVGERLLLLAVEAQQLQPGHLRGVLDLGAVPLELLVRLRARRSRSPRSGRRRARRRAPPRAGSSPLRRAGAWPSP